MEKVHTQKYPEWRWKKEEKEGASEHKRQCAERKMVTWEPCDKPAVCLEDEWNEGTANIMRTLQVEVN